MFWIIIIFILAAVLLVQLGKLIALILPDSVRLVIGIILGLGGVIFLFIVHWALGVFVGIPWLIACYLVIEGSDIG